RRRYRPPRPSLDPPAVDRLPAPDRPLRDRRHDRDRPLHRLAGPGPDLHDRLPRDRAAPSGDRDTRWLPVRPPRVPRPGPRSRLIAAGDALTRAPELGGDTGLTYESKPIPSASSVRSSRPRRPP